ncbi:MAG: hypothetical protein ACPGUV_05370 [Polyangiales bacterium]
MTSTAIVDSGPLIALFDNSDRHHQVAVDFVRGFDGVLTSNHAVVTEVLHLLDFHVRVQIIEGTGIHCLAIESRHEGMTTR